MGDRKAPTPPPIDQVKPDPPPAPPSKRFPSITCSFCQRVSYNPNDIAQKLCGACHRFHDDPQPESFR